MFPSKYKDDSSKSPGLLFIRAYNNWHTQVRKALQPIGLTHPQFVVLAVIAYLQSRYEHVTQVMISTHSDIDVMTTSQILKILEKKKFIQKKPHPNDTRANIVELLEEGKRKVATALPIVEGIDDSFFGVLESNHTEFMACLEKLSIYNSKD
ncbi:winged helix-turn-helix transcriptional regulator [Heliobacterium chlorum]|uniref:Winged helix-turn-helix transcriptional regulator n=1 Tax=Heliobacterium chlorum TaxID=2698 RepID=A0ABR7T768_HELCL|nr:MarR family winged helix-turn-helix transcriptional regulator [Heliobacterium chlorum]MBC9785531.1 winged helix-turn-helix transcriptional regulator [Heliobacterium chlorum]